MTFPNFNVFLIVLFAMTLTLGQSQHLIKEPNTERVMLSDPFPGIKLYCYFNESDYVSDGSESTRHRRSTSGEALAAEVEDDDPDDDVDRIKWFLTENGSDVEVEIDEDEFVSIDEEGRSVR